MAYTPYNFDFTPTYLNSLSNSLNTLQKRHDATIEGASKLKEAIAKLPLNAAEEGYRQDLLNKIETTLDSDTIGGFGGFGYDNIVKLSGDIASDEGLLGRLRAQESYQKFQDLTDNRNDIDQDTKDYIKEVNQYNFDPNTNGDWKPTYAGVKQYSMDEIYKLAMNYVTPDKGSFETIKYMDANGTITDKYDPNSTLGYFSSTTNRFERVTEDMIAKGLEAAMKVNPGIRASLEQDYNVGLWKDNKNKGTDNYIRNQLLYNNDGTTKSFNEYVTDITTPFIKSKAYYHNEQHSQFNTSLMNTMAKYDLGISGNGKNGSGKGKGLYDPYLLDVDVDSVPGFKVTTKDNSISTAQNNIVNINDSFRRNIINNPIFKNIGIDASKIDFNNPRNTRSYLLSKLPNLSQDSINFVNSIYEQMKYQNAINEDDIKIYNDALENKQKYASEISLYNAITNGINLKIDNLGIDNELLNKYGLIIDNIFTKGNISHNIKDKNEYNRICEFLKVNKEGSPYKGGEINGQYYVSLDKENSNYFLQFKNAIDSFITKGNKWGYFNGDKILNYKNSYSYFHDNSLKDFEKFYNGLHNDQVLNENDDNTILVDTKLYSGITFNESLKRGLIADENTNSQIANRFKDIIKQKTTDFISLLRGGANLTELEIGLYNDEGYYNPATSKERMALSNYISGINADDIIINNIVTNDGRNLPVITLPAIEKNGKIAREEKQFIIGGLENHFSDLKQYTYNPTVKALSEINKMINNNSQLTFAVIKDDSGNYINYSLKNAGDNQFIVNVDGEDISTIKLNQAIALREMYNNIMASAGIGSLFNEETVANVAKQYINPLQETIEKIFGFNAFDKNYIDVITDMLGG